MSVEKYSNRPTAQAGNVSFELHTLGWEAFQNLCGHVAREILGQTVTAFSSSNDAGQDGAFQGSWQKSKQESFRGRFVIQCKFTSRRDEHLSLGDLRDEIVKAERLANRGLVQTYLLMTNARVSGEADNLIREAFRKINGIEYFELFGAEWFAQQILESKRLRAFVPRVYGLGDLSQILDERVYRQTDEILQTWRDNLAKFVPTEAHHKSVKALFDEGFVLLLGDPMAGKSTIAAALAIAAADQWKCVPVFATHPNDFKGRWNPDEPNQFFWVDDAFGQTQFDASLAEGWNRLFPHLTAAIRKGTKVLFTSRTYIYQAAKRELKEAAFPLIRSSHVTIEVENLKPQEKERILYNHLKLLLPEIHRRAFVSRAIQEVVKSAESTFLDDDIRGLLTQEELETALACIRHELLPSLASVIERHAVEYDDIDEEPSDHFQDFSNDLENLRDFFEELDDGESVEALERGQQLIEEAVERLGEWKSEQEKEAKRKRAEDGRGEESRAAEEEMIGAVIAEYEREGGSSAKPKSRSSQPRFQIPVPPRSIFEDVDS